MGSLYFTRQGHFIAIYIPIKCKIKAHPFMKKKKDFSLLFIMLYYLQHICNIIDDFNIFRVCTANSFLARNCWKAAIKISSWGSKRPGIEKKQGGYSPKSPPFQARHWDRIRHRGGEQHACIYPQPLALNKNTKCIHHCGHIFCLHWQLFNSYSSQCKWADSLPLPIEVKWYEQLNINDWEWLMDPPTRRPPQTDRNSDRRMHPSACFLTFHSVSHPSVSPFSRRFRRTWAR